MWWIPEQRIETFEHRLDRSKPVGEILVDARGYGIVAACGFEYMQVMVDRIFEPRETSIVEERRLQRDVSER